MNKADRFIVSALLCVGFWLVLSGSANAEPLYVLENEDVKVTLTDEPCAPAILARIEPFAHFAFRHYVAIGKSSVAAAQGAVKIIGCWSDNSEYAPPGYIVWINELGNAGYETQENLAIVKKGVGV